MVRMKIQKFFPPKMAYLYRNEMIYGTVPPVQQIYGPSRYYQDNSMAVCDFNLLGRFKEKKFIRSP